MFVEAENSHRGVWHHLLLITLLLLVISPLPVNLPPEDAVPHVLGAGIQKPKARQSPDLTRKSGHQPAPSQQQPRAAALSKNLGHALAFEQHQQLIGNTSSNFLGSTSSNLFGSTSSDLFCSTSSDILRSSLSAHHPATSSLIQRPGGIKGKIKYKGQQKGKKRKGKRRGEKRKENNPLACINMNSIHNNFIPNNYIHTCLIHINFITFTASKRHTSTQSTIQARASYFG